MSNDELILEYTSKIKALKKQCLEAGINETDFREMYHEFLESINENRTPKAPDSRYTTMKTKLLILLTIIGVAFYFNTVYTCLLCNLPEYIYLGLRLLRKLSIPLISLFPSLGEYYHESCLLQNPYFTVTDMDCWPCSTVNNVREIDGPIEPIHSQNNAPFTYETNQKEINFDNLKNIYMKHEVEFDTHAKDILNDNKYYTTAHELFQLKNINNHVYSWKFNNMNIARILRQYIPRPTIVPKYGQSIERFIIIDNAQEKFSLPDTECNFSFLMSLSGSRIIKLLPSEECKHQCKALKIELKTSYLLWYNWWYWRPVIQPSSSNVTFISHVGSYC